MSRKSQTITIETEGRDKGKVFILNEMSAHAGEKWAIKAFLAMARSGVDLPDNITSMGFAGIAQIGIKMLTQIHFNDLEPLLDEMFAMITYLPDPSKPTIKLGYGGVGAIPDDTIEEIQTLLKLRKDILLLHVNFSTAAGLLN